MAKEIENIQDKLNWHWRNSMQTVRFFSFDARAAMPVPLLLVYARWSTVILTIVFLVFFRFLERQGLTFPAAIRTFRLWVVGIERPGLLQSQRKKFIDYG